MSTPIQSLHLQSTMLIFRYLPAPRLLQRIMLRTVFWPVTKLQLLYLRRRNGPPRPLKLRKRSYSVSRPVSGKAQKKPIFQVNSDLLTKLPHEIRQLIWKEALGGMGLHLKIENRHLRGQRCTEEQEPDTCWEFFGLQAKPKERKRAPKRHLLALLLTCRQVYSEAKEYLYSENVFDSLFFECILYLPRIILPQRITSIRALYFLWYLEEPPTSRRHSKEHLHLRYDQEVWQTMWRNLASMTGLTNLGIHLYIDPVYHQDWTEVELDLLEDVRQVTKPTKFTLYLPFGTDAKEEELQGFPCTIVRTIDGA